MGDLVGHERAATAAALGPPGHAGLEEEPVDDQLAAPLEQVEQARRPVRALEAVVLLHGHTRHPAAFGRQRIARPGQLLLLHEQFLARSVPLLRRHDRRHVHSSVLVSSWVGQATAGLRGAGSRRSASARSLRMAARRTGAGAAAGARFTCWPANCSATRSRASVAVMVARSIMVGSLRFGCGLQQDVAAQGPIWTTSRDSFQRSARRRRSSSARSTSLALSAIARSYARAAPSASPARLSSSACAAYSGWYRS